MGKRRWVGRVHLQLYKRYFCYMKNNNKTEISIYVLLCVVCLQKQPACRGFLFDRSFLEFPYVSTCICFVSEIEECLTTIDAIKT